MPTSRVKFAPTGFTFPADPNLPGADTSTLGLALAAALADLPVEHVFLPNKIQSLAGSTVVGGRDMGANDGWYNEGVGAGPAATTINSLTARDFDHAAFEAFRAMRSDTHRSWAVVGGLEVTSDNLALTGSDGARSVFIKIWDSDVTKFSSLRLVDTGDDDVDYWTLAQEGVSHISATAPSAGRYVYCASFKYTDRTLKLYVNSATSTIIADTVDSDKNNASTGKWGIGGYPGAGYNWEGPLGYTVILHGELHGSVALDAARLAAMTALASPSFGYDVTLT